MKMIAHETIGVHLPISLLAGFTECFQKALAIEVIQENVLTAIATIHHMINRSGILHSHLTWHAVEPLSPQRQKSTASFQTLPSLKWRSLIMHLFIPDPFADQEKLVSGTKTR